MLKISLKRRSKVKVEVTKSNVIFWYGWKGLVTRKTNMKFESKSYVQ